MAAMSFVGPEGEFRPDPVWEWGRPTDVMWSRMISIGLPTRTIRMIITYPTPVPGRDVLRENGSPQWDWDESWRAGNHGIDTDGVIVIGIDPGDSGALRTLDGFTSRDLRVYAGNGRADWRASPHETSRR